MVKKGVQRKLQFAFLSKETIYFKNGSLIKVRTKALFKWQLNQF